MTRISSSLWLLVPVTLLAACRGKDGTGPPTASDLLLVSGNGQTGIVGQALSQPLTVKAAASSGVGVEGVTVTWAVSAGGGTVSATSVATDAQGLAAVTLTLGPGVGPANDVVTASVAGLSGSPVTFTAAATAGAPAQLVAVSGGSQSDTVGHQLAQPLVVVASDHYGNPVPGVTVSWAVTAGAGTLSAAANVTDAQGQSSVTWTLGDSSGTQNAAASLPGAAGSPVSFSALASNAAPAALEFVTQPSSGSAGAAIAPPVQVAIVDAFGNTVTTATNAVAMTIAANPGGATLSGTTQLDAVGGVATFSDLSLDKTGSGYTLQASSSGLTTATSAAFDMFGVSGRLVFTVQPTPTGTGLPITPAVEVTAEDAFGNTITGFTGDVTIALGTNPAGGTLSGTLTVPAVAGVATFSDLSIDKAGTGYTLVATATGFSDAASDSFAIILVDNFVSLTFATQPTSTTAGVAISPPVVVCAYDGLGNVITSFNGSITIGLAVNQGGGTLSGTLTATAAAGCATFSDLSIDKAGTSYALLATAAAVTSTTSMPFDVTPAPASTIAVDGGDQQTAMAGTTLAVPYSVLVADSFGNPVAGVTVDWAVTSGGGSVSPAQSTTDTSGIASTTRTLGPNAGTQTATATAAGLAGSPITFTATATVATIGGIAPDTLVEVHGPR